MYGRLIASAISLFTRWRREPRLNVLMFHKLPERHDSLCPDELLASEFTEVLDFLQLHGQVLPLSEARQRTVQGKLDPFTVCLTFDDGYPEWLSLIGPALLARQMPATFFVTTGQLGGVPLWHERLIHLVKAIPPEALGGLNGISDNPALPLQARRAHVLGQLLNHAKYLPVRARTDLIQTFEKLMPGCKAIPSGFNENSVRWLAQKGFDIGAHTVNHPILTECTEAEAYAEIGGAKESLEAILRQPVRCFAYPNGRPEQDYALKHVDMVRRCGYGMAVSTSRGSVGPESDPYQLPRFGPWRMSSSKLAFQLARNALKSGERAL